MKNNLIIMTGRWRDRQHVYVVAKNKTDAARLLNEAWGFGASSIASWLYEINVYFSKGCWGNPMEGIEIERGVWITDSKDKNPKRII